MTNLQSEEPIFKLYFLCQEISSYSRLVLIAELLIHISKIKIEGKQEQSQTCIKQFFIFFGSTKSIPVSKQKTLFFQVVIRILIHQRGLPHPAITTKNNTHYTYSPLNLTMKFNFFFLLVSNRALI